MTTTIVSLLLLGMLAVPSASMANRFKEPPADIGSERDLVVPDTMPRPDDRMPAPAPMPSFLLDDKGQIIRLPDETPLTPDNITPATPPADNHKQKEN